MSTERLSQISLYLDDIVQSITVMSQAIDAIAKEYSSAYKTQREIEDQVNSDTTTGELNEKDSI